MLAKTLQPHESVVLSAQIVEELKEVKLTLLLLFIAEVGTNFPRVWTASSMADPIVSRTKSAALLFQRIPDAEEADIKIGILHPHAKYLLPHANHAKPGVQVDREAWH